MRDRLIVEVVAGGSYLHGTDVLASGHPTDKRKGEAKQTSK